MLITFPDVYEKSHTAHDFQMRKLEACGDDFTISFCDKEVKIDKDTYNWFRKHIFSDKEVCVTFINEQ